DMAFLKDKSFRYLLVNDAYLDFLGIDSKEEVMGKTDFELLPQKLAEQCRESDQKVLREGKPVNEVEEGMDSIFESRKFPVYLADGSVGIGGLIRDITEQKRAVEALQAAEKKYRESIENANVGIIVYDSEGEVRMVNPRMEQMIGYQREEIPTLKEWFQKLYPTEEERRKIRSIWFQRMNEEGEVRGGDAVITTKQSEKRHFLFNGVQLESGDSLAFARDITQQKKMEEEIKKKSEELRRLNEKLEIVGKIARHDVRNKLSTVATNLYLAKKQLGDQHEVVDYLEDIKTAVDQTNEILDFAKAYEQLGTQELEPMDVGQVVEDATQQFSNLKGIEVVNECWGLKVRADQTLSHIFYNLIHNSLQHGGEEVSRVRVYCQETGENQVKVVYEDDGEGIPVEEKEKVFQEGYGAGTGYGLYLIREMCKVYGWTIKECGQQGEGARFTITIPQ
ncbi:MAG: PAS domain-containing protein, partial [Thermoproteota archaeon]